MPAKLSIHELCTAFDTLRFDSTDLPIDIGEVIERPRGDTDELIIRIDTGIASGFEARALSVDWPGDPAERAVFYRRASKGERVQLQLKIVNLTLVRVRVLGFAVAKAA